MILWSIVMGVHCYPILSFIFSPSISTPFWTPVYIGLVVWIITVHKQWHRPERRKIYDRIPISYSLSTGDPTGTYLRKSCRVGAHLADMILPYASE
jgi:hypothetical protein